MTDDSIQTARDIVSAPDDDFDAFLANVETAVRRHASWVDVAVDDAAVRAVQRVFCDMLVQSYARGPDHTATLLDGRDDDPDVWFDRLADEMADPASTSATTNIGVAVARAAAENDGCRRLLEAGLAHRRHEP